MVEKRNTPKVMHCTWCGSVRAGNRWVAERRKARPGPYAEVICKTCKGFYFGEFDLKGYMADGKDQDKVF